LGALFGIVFSLTLVAVQLASQTYSPRLITLFLRDKWTRFFIGFYLFAILYNVILLNAVPKEFSNFPLLGNFGLIVDFRWLILGSIVLSVISAFVMCWYIKYVLDLLKPENIVKRLIEDIKIEKVDNDLKEVKVSFLPIEDTIKRLIDIKDEETIIITINDIKNLIFERYKNVEKINSNDIEFLNFVIDFIYKVGVLCLDKGLYRCVIESVEMLCDLIVFFIPRVRKIIEIEKRYIPYLSIFQKSINAVKMIDSKIINKIPKFTEEYGNDTPADIIALIEEPPLKLSKCCEELIKNSKEEGRYFKTFIGSVFTSIEYYYENIISMLNSNLMYNINFTQKVLSNINALLTIMNKNLEYLSDENVWIFERIAEDIIFIVTTVVDRVIGIYEVNEIIRKLWDMAEYVAENEEINRIYRNNVHPLGTILEMIEEIIKKLSKISPIDIVMDIIDIRFLRIIEKLIRNNQYHAVNIVINSLMSISHILIINKVSEDILIKNFEILKEFGTKLIEYSSKNNIRSFIEYCIYLAIISLKSGYNRFPEEIAIYLKEINKISKEKLNKNLVDEILTKIEKKKAFRIKSKKPIEIIEIPIKDELLEHFQKFKEIYYKNSH
jgi:hypothetical protein